MNTKKPHLWWDICLNPFFGCKPKAAGCTHCWAAASFWDDKHNRPAAGREDLVMRDPKFGNIRWTGQIQINNNFGAQLFELAKLPPGSVVAFEFMGDIFLENKDSEHMCHIVFALAQVHKHLVFVVTTKRPERIRTMWADYYERLDTIAPNVWLLCSVSTQKDLVDLLPQLEGVRASVIGLSLEPMLEEVDLAPYFEFMMPGRRVGPLPAPGENPSSNAQFPPGQPWVILGAEKVRRSMGVSRFFAERWAYKIVYDCVAAGCPVFYKYGPGEAGFCNSPLIDGKVWHYYPKQLAAIREQQTALFPPAAAAPEEGS